MDTRSFHDQLADMWRTRPVRLPGQGHVAGVASGIGVRYGVDPVLIRVAFVASALFGGAGIVLYLAAWLLFTRHGDEVSPLEALVGRGSSSDSTTKVVVILVALAIATGAIGPVGAGSGGSGFIGTVLMLGGWWLLYQRRPEPPVLPTPEGTSTFVPPAFPQPPMTAPNQYPWSMHTAFMQTAPFGATGGGTPAESVTEQSTEDPTTVRSSSTMPDLRKEPADPTAGLSAPRSSPPAWDPLGVAPFAWDLPEPATTRPPVPAEKTRSRLTTTVLGLAVIAAATAGAVGAAADLAWVTPARVGAVALAVIGVGLLIGAFLHRGYGLLVVTGPLLGFVILASIVGPLDTSGWGNRTWDPTTTAELQSEYSSRFGRMNLDLRGLDLTEDRTVHVDGRFGEVEVLLPPDLDVRATCTATAAEIRQCPEPGLDAGGNGVDGPVLTLDADIEYGSLEVRRG